MSAINGMLQVLVGMLIAAIALQIAEYQIPVLDGALKGIGAEVQADPSGAEAPMSTAPADPNLQDPGQTEEWLEEAPLDQGRPASAPADTRSDLRFLLDKAGGTSL